MHALDDFEILVRHLIARSDWIARHPIGSACHLRSIMDPVAQLNPRQPLVRAGARPAWYDQAQRRPVLSVQRASVHREGDQHVVGHRLGQRYTARDRQLVRLPGEVGVGPVVRGVDDTGLWSSLPEHVG